MIKKLIKTIQEKLILGIEKKTTWGKNELKMLISDIFIEILSELADEINNK